MLAAARRLFAAKGYEQTSIRAIAAEADVNQALVITYFGGKDALFMEAVGRFEIPQEALAGDKSGLGSRLARAFVARWETMAGDDPWPALVRSAVSHEASRELLASALEEQQTVPLAKVLADGEDAPARSAMVQCLIAGMIMQRYIYALEPTRSLSAEQFEEALAACLQHAVSGPLVPGGREEAAS